MSLATVSEQSTARQVENTQCFINNEWVDAASGKTFTTIHPANEAPICQIAEGDMEDVGGAT